jgi:tetratricopeptide (TPR) repeat protein
MGAVAEARARARDFEGALADSREISDDSTRSDLLAFVAREQAKAGDITGALATVETVQHRFQGAVAAEAISAAAAAAGDPAGALAAARMIRYGPNRANALLSIARERVRGGDLTGAKELLAEALAAVWTTPDPINHESNATALVAAAEVLADLGDPGKARELVTEALDIARLIRVEASRAFALRSIAQSPLCGLLGLGHAILVESESLDADRGLPNIAEAFCAAGDRRHFKPLLLRTAYHWDAAWRMCACLVRLYPGHAPAMATRLRDAGLLGEDKGT